MVVLDEPARDLTGLKRSERVELLTSQAADQRRLILDALREAGLVGEVEIPEATAFSVLPIRASGRAMEAIRAVSGVKDVLPVGGALSVDFP